MGTVAANNDPIPESIEIDVAETQVTPKEKSVIRPMNEYFMSSSTVKIYVGEGEERREWTLPEELLCDHSEYFKATFRGEFQEATSKELVLADDNPDAFALLVNFMCTGKTQCSTDHNRRNWSENLPCYALFVLADKIQMDKLAAKAIAHLEACANSERMRLPLAQKVLYIYENTLDESPLRKLVSNEMMRYFFTSYRQGLPSAQLAWNKLISNEEFRADTMMAINNHASIQVHFHCDIVGCITHEPDMKAPAGRAVKRKLH